MNVSRFLLAAAVAAFPVLTHAQLPYAGSGQVHVENFNWTAGGTQTNLPWVQNAERQTWALEGTRQLGWYASFDAPPTSFGINNGTANTGGGLLSNFFYTSGDLNRSLGGRPTGAAGPLILALRLRNTSSATLTEFTIGYALGVTQQRDAEVSNTATFAYRLGGDESRWSTASFIEPGAAFNATTPFVPVASNVNASLPANRGVVSGQTITGITWEPGQDLWIRWTVPNVANGPNVGLDDVVFVARNPDVVTPPPPGNVRVSQVGDLTIRVQWDDQLQDEDGYIIERSTQPDSGFAELARVGANVTLYNDDSTDTGTTYFYRILTLRGGVLSVPSETISIERYVGPPAAPVNGSVRVVSSVSILLRWQDDAFNEEGFVVERSTAGGIFEEIGRTLPGRLSFTDSPVEPSTAYQHRIAAYNQHGLSEYLELDAVTTPEIPTQFGYGPPDIDESRIGRTLYVSVTEGSDSNDGLSSAAPLRTIEKAVQIAAGFNSQNIGVKIFIAPGVYLEGEPNRDVDFGAVTLTGSFATEAPLIIEGQGWAPGVNTGDVILTGAERWTHWSQANPQGVHTAPWPYKWGLNPRAQAVAPDVIKRFELIWVRANGEWRNYIQMDNASDSRINNLEPEDGWFWVSEADETIYIRPPAGVDLTDPEVEVRVTVRKRLLHHWRPQTSTGLTPLTIRNLVVEHSGDIGIYLQNMNDVIVEDMVFRRNKIEGYAYGFGARMRLSRSAFYDNSTSGFGGSGVDLLIEDVQVLRNGRLAVYSNYTGWANQGFKLGNANRVTIRRLHMEDNWGVQAWLDTGMFLTEIVDSYISGGLTSGVFIENNNPNNIPGLGETTTVRLRNNVIVNQNRVLPKFPNLVGRGVSIGENFNAIVENNLIANNLYGIALASNVRGESFFNVVRGNVVAGEKQHSQPLYLPRNGLIDWQQFFDTLDSRTNDNIYMHRRVDAFTGRNGQALTFAEWKATHPNNPANTRADRAVDSRSAHLLRDYAGETMIGMRVLNDYVTGGEGRVEILQFSRLAEDLSQRVEVALSYSTGPGYADDDDFAEPLPTSIVFAPGETEVIVAVEAIDHERLVGDRRLEVFIETDGFLVPVDTVFVTVLDPDAAGIAQVSIATAADVWIESDGRQAITLQRLGNLSEELTVRMTLSGTAVEGADFTVPGREVVFAAGEAVAAWWIDLLDDEIPAVDKTIIIAVEPATDGSYVLGFPNTVTFILRDDDVFQLVDGAETGGNPFVLDWGIANPADGSVGFTVEQANVFYAIDWSEDGNLVESDWSLPANAATVPFNWLNTNDDGISNALPLGFDFPFGDETYSAVYVHSNGFLTFVALPDANLPYRSPVDLPSTSNTAPAAMLAPFWTDLGLDAQSSIRYGKTDSGTFVVEFRNVPKFPILFGVQRVNFRVVLRANGIVYFQYQSSQYNAGLRVGYQDSSRTTGAILASTVGALGIPTTIRLTPAGWIRASESTVAAAPGETTWLRWTMEPWNLDYGIYEESFALVNPDSPLGELDFSVSVDNRPFWMQAGWKPDANGWFQSRWTGAFSEVGRPWHYHADLGWFLALHSTPDAFLGWFAESGWIAFDADWAGWAYFHDAAEWHRVAR